MNESRIRKLPVLQGSWEYYAARQLPVDRTEREQHIAADAFKGGARALFGIVYAINSHSTDNVLLTRVLECLGHELGLDEGAGKRSS